MGARLQKLEFIHQKVFPQAGQSARLRSQLKVPQTSLKKVLFGEHGERSGAPARNSRCEDSRIEVRADQPLRRRRLFQLRDHRRPAGCPLTQRAGEAPRLVGGRRLLQSPG